MCGDTSSLSATPNEAMTSFWAFNDWIIIIGFTLVLSPSKEHSVRLVFQRTTITPRTTGLGATTTTAGLGATTTSAGLATTTGRVWTLASQPTSEERLART